MYIYVLAILFDLLSEIQKLACGVHYLDSTDYRLLMLKKCLNSLEKTMSANN